MKSLHHKVNIVPVIAKADMLTQVELKKLKKKVNVWCVAMKMMIATVTLLRSSYQQSAEAGYCLYCCLCVFLYVCVSAQ